MQVPHDKLFQSLFTSNLHEIVPKVYIGNCIDARNKVLLKKHNIGAIVIAAKEYYPSYPSEFTYKRFNLSDTNLENIKIYFKESNDFIKKNLGQGKGVLVHCAAGVSRSATLVLAYLMETQQMKFQDAFTFMRKKHPLTCPNDGFRSQLIQYEKDLKLT